MPDSINPLDQRGVVDLSQFTHPPQPEEPEGIAAGAMVPFTIQLTERVNVNVHVFARGITREEYGSRMWQVAVDQLGRVIVDFMDDGGELDPVQLIGPDAVMFGALMMDAAVRALKESEESEESKED